MRHFRRLILLALAVCSSCSFQMSAVAGPPAPDKSMSKRYQYAEPHKNMWLRLPSGHLRNYGIASKQFCNGHCNSMVKKLEGKCPDPVNGPCVISTCTPFFNKPTLCVSQGFDCEPALCQRSGNIPCTP